MSEHLVRDDTDPVRVGGRYVLQDELGRGGMATVQRAHDPVLDRTVAVKLLHDHLADDPAFLERFRREARAAAALDHPNVVAVHDWGETDDGAYLVLQLVDGPSLREVLRTHERLSPAATLAVLGPAAAGLAAAHDAGLVHRDVKPENLLLGRDGGVRVTDFGLARAAASATATFGADVLVGSPHYLSPEAVRGEPLDPRADVYALGVVLFECLTGRPPHEGESPYATAVAHTARPVPPPSTIVEDLDPGLDEVVRRATAIDRAERYPDAAAFGAALAAAVRATDEPFDRDELPAELAPPPLPRDGGTQVIEPDHAETTVVAPDAPPDRRQRPPRRGWLVLVIVLALVAGSGLGGYLLWDRVLAPMLPVPDVLGEPADAATRTLEEAGFEVAVADDPEHDLEVAAGQVLRQDPAGELRAGRTVRLVISAGPRMLDVPGVAGEDPADAAERIDRAGFNAVLDERYDELVPDGQVVGTEPQEGTTVAEASDVTVIVSRGPRPIEVPGLVGSSESSAAAALSDLGLVLEVGERRYDEEAEEGTILVQEPEPGTTLYRDQAVSVTVSRGPQPIELPNVRGMVVDDAVSELRGLGLEVEVERRGGFRAFLSPGRVYEQDPGPGSVVYRGEMIQLWAYED